MAPFQPKIWSYWTLVRLHPHQCLSTRVWWSRTEG